jgi:hypothetical protein
MSAQPKFEDYP